MIRFGFRLAVAGGREAVARLAMIAVAVAIGGALLLATVASINAFRAQNRRYAWLETGYPGATVGDSGSAQADPLWWELQGDMYAGVLIGRVDVAATGPDAPVPPGIPALPAPGEYYASPALSRLLRDAPAAQLADRYPGREIGAIGGDALASPDSLVIIVGRDLASLRADADPHAITRISTTGPDECTGECAPGVGTDSAGMTLVLGVVAAALLFPVLMFIGGATRLAAARREQRLAAMRLIGATPRQISTISTVEAFLATVTGVAMAFVLFAAARPAISSIPFSGERFFTRDLSLTAANVVLVAIGIPVAAAVAARIALRRVVISPLGVRRRVTPRPPRPRRMVVLAAGTAWMIYLAYGSEIQTWRSIDQAYAYLAGVFTIMIGLVVAGPWLTLVGARLAARHASRPARLVAARRLADDPRTAFRAVSGLVLAAFVATCATGIITTIVFNNTGSTSAAATTNAKGTLVRHFDLDGATALAAVPEATRADLVAIPGVDGMATVRHDPEDAGSSPFSGAPRQTYVDCAALATTPAFGRCPPGAPVAAIDVDFGGAVIQRSTPMSTITWPAADVTVGQLAAMPIDLLIVSTDGTRAAVERARTVLERLPGSIGYAPGTITESTSRSSREIDRYRQLANVVLLTSLPIAGCSLAVSVAGGLAERRRPFSLLRLTGVPLTTLRRIVGLETTVPLLISLAVSAAAGFAAASLFVRAQLHQTIRPPDPTYYLLMLGGIIVSLAVVASTFPLLTRLTGPETARND